MSQAVVVYVLAFALGVQLRLDPVSIFGVFVVIVLGSALFATFSLIIACIVKSQERFMGIGQILTMPLFFASSAVYPVSLMPDWLKVVSTLNPLTYMVDALRQLMVSGVGTESVLVDVAVLTGVALALVALAARLYPRLAQ
jgi:ABC-2 type transport system permease protein